MPGNTGKYGMELGDIGNTPAGVPAYAENPHGRLSRQDRQGNPITVQSWSAEIPRLEEGLDG